MSEKRSVTIKLEESTYRKLRLHSASNLISMMKIVEEAIEEYLKKRKV